MTNSATEDKPNLISTGVAGLDEVLGGGLTPHRLYLVQGVPGAGKTTLALQFLVAGAARGEPVLYLSLSETRDEIEEVSRSHGWSLDGVEIRQLAPSEESLRPDQQYTVFHPSEVELAETTKRILGDVEGRSPTRVVLDSLAELRLLAGNALRYRRQVLALKQFFAGRRCTFMILDDRVAADAEGQLETIAHGVVYLDQLEPDYGADRRRLRVSKYRGRAYREGHHDYVIRRGGLVVFPRLVAADSRRPAIHETLSSGVPALDQILGGGLARGTSTLVTGPAGVGKSSLAMQFATAAAARGRRSAAYLFDESLETALARGDGLGMRTRENVDAGLIAMQQIDPAELSLGEFGGRVCAAADSGVDIVIIDSLNGYMNAMANERFLLVHLHELLSYLGQRGIATLLVGVQGGLIGSNMVTGGDASYVADGIILMRYFEYAGRVRQALSVVKKRAGAHERAIREFSLGPNGVQVGEPLDDFQGVLTGVPVYRGSAAPLLKDDDT